MNKSNKILQRITADRRILQNPYAHLSDLDGFDEVTFKKNTVAIHNSINSHSNERQLLNNPYAYINDTGDFERVSSNKSAVVIQNAISSNTCNRQLLQNPYALLNDVGGFDDVSVKKNVDVTPTMTHLNSNSRLHLQDPYAYLNDKGLFDTTPEKQTVNSHIEIEQKARNLQLSIWKNREQIWPEGVPTDPVDMLTPEIAIQFIGYKYEDAEYLGDFNNKESKIAGIIDQLAKRISISHRFSPKVRRFTAAHELGHAILHNTSKLHRDRPIDGSDQRREKIEIEADKFATYFLMPEKLVKKYFMQAFGVNTFILSEDTAFALDPSDPVGLVKKCKAPRDLSKLLAKSEYFNGKHLKSLAERFHVSIETMAIRIEELNLIDI